MIKIGSNVLTKSDGNPDLPRMKKLVSQVKVLQDQGKKIVLISSGAVAFGRQRVTPRKKLNAVLKKQLWASIGQISLINEYQRLFGKQDLNCAQILVTKEDFRDRKHYLNMKNCLEGLLEEGVIPIINENDTIAITELMFTDNDELASLVSGMINADTLILLSNVDGIYDGDPSLSDSKLISVIKAESRITKDLISPTKSSFGRGGMMSKYSMAKKSANLGTQVLIANGKRDNILPDILDGNAPSTWFEPKATKQGTKKWLAHGESHFKAQIIINHGAEKSLNSEVIRSLLPVGVVKIDGDFARGDILQICNEEGKGIGLGRAEYGSNLARERIGLQRQKALIHYNYLYLFEDE